LRDINTCGCLDPGNEKFFQSPSISLSTPKISTTWTACPTRSKTSSVPPRLFPPVYYQSEQELQFHHAARNDELFIAFNMNSSPIASSFPFISSELTSDRGILYGINRHITASSYSTAFLQNANSVVFATSGAGKSYAIKLEILRSLMLGAEVIVIDRNMNQASGRSGRWHLYQHFPRFREQDQSV
jgi:hypothetical protein